VVHDSLTDEVRQAGFLFTNILHNLFVNPWLYPFGHQSLNGNRNHIQPQYKNNNTNLIDHGPVQLILKEIFFTSGNAFNEVFDAFSLLLGCRGSVLEWQDRAKVFGVQLGELLLALVCRLLIIFLIEDIANREFLALGFC
jgi:hypothetical protein